MVLDLRKVADYMLATAGYEKPYDLARAPLRTQGRAVKRSPALAVVSARVYVVE